MKLQEMQYMSRLLTDITTYYNNDSEHFSEDQYKRKPLPEILGECHLCGVLLDDECEIVVDGNDTFCSEYHKNEFKTMKDEGEI